MGTLEGGTMILVDRDYVSFIDRIEPPEYVHSPYFANVAQGVLELSIARFRPCWLPREFTTVIVACVYIPAYTNNKARQANAVYRLLDAMGKVIADNGKPLIYICGDPTALTQHRSRQTSIFASSTTNLREARKY